MKCAQCGSSQFRTSRFRREDLFRLLWLRYPIRCRSCQQRDYAGVFTAMKIHGAEKIRRRERRGRREAEASARERA